MNDSPRALTAEEFERHMLSGQPADWFLISRMLVTIRLMMQVERQARLLCKVSPGVYSSLELALGALEMRRQP